MPEASFDSVYKPSFNCASPQRPAISSPGSASLGRAPNIGGLLTPRRTKQLANQGWVVAGTSRATYDTVHFRPIALENSKELVSPWYWPCAPSFLYVATTKLTRCNAQGTSAGSDSAHALSSPLVILRVQSRSQNQAAPSVSNQTPVAEMRHYYHVRSSHPCRHRTIHNDFTPLGYHPPTLDSPYRPPDDDTRLLLSILLRLVPPRLPPMAERRRRRGLQPQLPAGAHMAADNPPVRDDGRRDGNERPVRRPARLVAGNSVRVLRPRGPWHCCAVCHVCARRYRRRSVEEVRRAVRVDDLCDRRGVVPDDLRIPGRRVAVHAEQAGF
ncbi:LOW QUALITY PROTEIN: hypothetical protein BC936DRAFT_146617 [Jimgerdemannia flammicorona]|uniref:Uncharacterized protein n=1 Tax=Jimgerdemannia flammicorona TaxID=994334 RepID=A0A433D7U9_9FUNG|nr:LOW QUALITY PROTEIN: hypothetical protein BC936DRAFT_146617 [Jimgerdemannia flammicorona]